MRPEIIVKALDLRKLSCDCRHEMAYTLGVLFLKLSCVALHPIHPKILTSTVRSLLSF